MLMMMLLAHDETAPASPEATTVEPGPLSTAPGEEAFDDWGLYTQALAASGVLVAGAGLEGPARARTIRHRDGAVLEVDGPFIESKEYLIGFYLLDVTDPAEASAWARRAPAVRDGAVEVREVRAGSTTGFGR